MESELCVRTELGKKPKAKKKLSVVVGVDNCDYYNCTVARVR